MKVAAFLYAYPPDRVAGADLMARDLLQALVAAGHEVRVFTTEMVPSQMRDGIMVERRLRFRRTGGWDTVYAHPDLGGEAPTMARRLGVPYVAVVHNTSPRTGRWLAQFPPDLIVWNAHATRDAHSGEGGIVCRSPLRVEDHEVDATGDMITLVNLNRAKGVDTFYALARAMPDQRFLGVRGGWGVQRDIDRPPNVEVVGPLPHHRMREVWERTRVLMMPSEAESWGRVALEAACSGIPTIAHPTPGLLEALGEAGVYADRGSPGQWVEAVRRLGNPAVFAARSRKVRERAREVEEVTRGDVEGFVSTVGSLRVLL